MSAPARILIGAGTASLALALGAGPVLSAMPSALAKTTGPTVKICHGTNSASNPYIVENPAADSKRLQGHESHVGPVYTAGMKAAKIVWGDIIPPFTSTIKGVTTSYAGLNWSTAGQAIWNNGCALPTTPPTTPPSSPPPSSPPPSSPPPSSPPPSSAPPSSPPASTAPTTPPPSSPPVTTAPTTPPVTGGGGTVTLTKTVSVPVTKKATGSGAGAAKITAAKTLPFTGSNTEELALYGLAAIMGGLGLTLLGQKKASHLR